MKSSFDLWGKLASGVPWTFAVNSFKMLKTVALDCKGWVYTVIGGDDVVVAKLSAAPDQFLKSARLRLRVTLEVVTQGYFEYHSFLHCAQASVPDLWKVALKVHSRRYPAEEHQLRRALQDYQIALRDVLMVLTDQRSFGSGAVCAPSPDGLVLYELQARGTVESVRALLLGAQASLQLPRGGPIKTATPHALESFNPGGRS